MKIFRIALLALMLSAGGAGYAQITSNWASYSTNNTTVTPNSITFSALAAPGGMEGAISTNTLQACKPKGYVQARFQETSNPSIESFLASNGASKFMALGLDVDGYNVGTFEVDYAIVIRKDCATGTYYLQAGAHMSFYAGAFYSGTAYSSAITFSNNDSFKIEKDAGNIKFYRNTSLLGSVPYSPNTNDLKIVAGVCNYYTSVNTITCNFDGSDPCQKDDEDWKGAFTGTMTPFNPSDNIYIPARLGIGVASPAEKLEVAGKVKISTIDNDNSLAKLLVADANGLVKYRDLISLPEAVDWRTSAGGIPTSLNDFIYKNGRVGINVATASGSLHVVNGACDNLPAVRITDTDASCFPPNNNGDLFYVESYNLSFTLLPRFVIKSNGLVGVGTASPSYMVDIAGNGRINTAWVVSDQRFKKNIQKLQEPMELIRRINGYTYEFRADEFKERNFTAGQQMGFIAQELKEVIPAAVDLASDGYYAVNYDAIVPLLVEALKAQDKKITELEQRLEQAENGREVKPSAGDPAKAQAVLYQNVPNPFSQNTEIRYMLPENVTDGRMLVFDMNGKQIKSIALRPGKGSVTISGSELSAGMYLYSLIAGGQEIDTKRMILTE